MKKEQKQSNEYIAFEGDKFLIEWYFDSKGKSIALDYFESLNEDEQIKLLRSGPDSGKKLSNVKFEQLISPIY